MAARTQGWGQIVLTAASGVHCLNASTDATVDPTLATVASDRGATLVYLTAGTGYSVRWGGQDALGQVWGWGTATNTVVLRCDVMLETTQSSAASDSTTIVGSATPTLNRTFTFTPAKSGTYRLAVSIVVTATTGGAAIANDNTDNGNFGSAAPSRLAGSTLSSFTPGLVRAGGGFTGLTQTPAAPYAYTSPVTTVQNTVTTAVAPYASEASQTIDLAWQDGGGGGFATTHTTFPASATTATQEPGLKVQQPPFVNAATALTLVVTPNASALSTALGGAGLPWTHWTAVPTGPGTVTRTNDAAGNAVAVTFTQAYTVDPRLTFTELLQLNDNTFSATADPLAKDVPDQRLTSDLGFLAARVTNSAGAGVNFTGNGSTQGIFYSLDDNKALVAAIVQNGGSTATQGTAADKDGWGPLMAWSAALPGGGWTNTVTFKDSAGTQGTAAFTYTLLASDPRISVVCGGGNADSPADHWSPGATFIAAIYPVDNSTGIPIAPSRVTSPRAAICRLNLALGRAEYLDGSNVWQPVSNGPLFFHTLTASPGDSHVYTKTFNAAAGFDTTGWGFYDIVTLGTCLVDSTPYGQFQVEQSVATHNKHSSPLSWLGIPN